MAVSNLQKQLLYKQNIYFMPFSAQKTVTFSQLDCAHISSRRRRPDFSSKNMKLLNKVDFTASQYNQQTTKTLFQTFLDRNLNVSRVLGAVSVE